MGVMNLVERYLIAARCFTREVLKERKLVSFLVMSVGAVQYIKENIDGNDLTPVQRECLKAALRLGVVVNNYWDEGVLEKDKYRWNRRKVRVSGKSDDYPAYYRDLVDLEGHRPNPQTSTVEEVFAYRERVNAVSLGWSCAAAGLGSYGDFVSEDRLVRSDTRGWFKDMWCAVMSLQVIDDQMGWVGDMKRNRPSFYTAMVKAAGLSRKEANHRLNLKQKEYL
jgi:hypothetical protein